MTALVIIAAIALFCLVTAATMWLIDIDPAEGRHVRPVLADAADAETSVILAFPPVQADIAGQTVLMAAPVLARRGEWTPRTEAVRNTPPWRETMAAELAPDALDAIAADLEIAMRGPAVFMPGEWLPVTDLPQWEREFLDRKAELGLPIDPGPPVDDDDPDGWVWEDAQRHTAILDRYDHLFKPPPAPADPVWPHWGSFTAWLSDDLAAAA